MESQAESNLLLFFLVIKKVTKKEAKNSFTMKAKCTIDQSKQELKYHHVNVFLPSLIQSQTQPNKTLPTETIDSITTTENRKK